MKYTTALASLAVVLPLVAAVPANLKQSGANGGAQTIENQKFAPPQKLQPAKVTPKGGAAAAAAKGAANVAAASTAAKGASSAAAATTAAAGAAKANTAAAAASTTTAAVVNASASSSSVAAAATSAAAASSANDLQKSFTLDPSQIQPGIALDGQAVPTAGQVASLTSTNNFINFCALFPELPLTNGQQILTGSCNPTPMGVIVAKAKMPSAKIISPQNLSNVKTNTTINFQIAVANMETGNFVNANTNFMGAPQQVNGDGLLVAHSHITVNAISSFTDLTPADPTKFVFFKGLNDAAVNGVLSATATGGLPAGFYRACTLNTAANHQPALVAVAQHASLDDCTYFQVSDNGSAAAANGAADPASVAAATGAGAAAGGAAAASTAAAANTAAASAASTTAAAAASTSAAAAAAGTGKQLTQTGATGGAKAPVKAKTPAFRPPQRGNQRGGRGRGRFN